MLDHHCLLVLLKIHFLIYLLNNKASNTYFDLVHIKLLSEFGFSRISLAG